MGKICKIVFKNIATFKQFQQPKASLNKKITIHCFDIFKNYNIFCYYILSHSVNFCNQKSYLFKILNHFIAKNTLLIYNILMKIKKLSLKNLNEIISLYNDIKTNSVNFWDNNYPNEEIIRWDIERNGLYGVFISNKLVGISFLGQRCEENEEDFTWKENFTRRGTFSRIGVSPDFQHQGIATQLVEFILAELKNRGFDGVRILVEKNNSNALGLYKKFNFNICGETYRYGHNFLLMEKRLL